MFRTILHLDVFFFSSLLVVATWLLLNAGKFCSTIYPDKMVYRRLFSLHKHITVADFTSLFFFCHCFYVMPCDAMLYRRFFVCILWLFSCFAAMLLSIWSEKTVAFLRFLIFRSYPFCVFVVMIPLHTHIHSLALSIFLSFFHTHSHSHSFLPFRLFFEQLVVRIRYIMFCLPSLMMFAIYIKIQFLDFVVLPRSQSHFQQKGNVFHRRYRLWKNRYCLMLRADKNESLDFFFIAHISTYRSQMWIDIARHHKMMSQNEMIVTRQLNQIFTLNSSIVPVVSIYSSSGWKILKLITLNHEKRNLPSAFASIFPMKTYKLTHTHTNIKLNGQKYWVRTQKALITFPSGAARSAIQQMESTTQTESENENESVSKKW